jgi:GrpB-like predicted nucleotidyltransferase (UPF0157 family)
MNPVEPIEIHEHLPAWADEFRHVGAKLRQALGTVALRIDHIGSTSIAGLAAKPILDLQVSVVALEPVNPFLVPMEALGYVWRRDNPDKTKRYFREAPGSRRTHIHVRKAGSWHEQFALLFRDYVRLHPAEQRKYEAVKRELATKYRLQRQKYTDAKDPIFWEIMFRADRWAATTGWEPGASDA